VATRTKDDVDGADKNYFSLASASWGANYSGTIGPANAYRWTSDPGRTRGGDARPTNAAPSPNEWTVNTTAPIQLDTSGVQGNEPLKTLNLSWRTKSS
jgi:hypothetical protein